MIYRKPLCGYAINACYLLTSVVVVVVVVVAIATTTVFVIGVVAVENDYHLSFVKHISIFSEYGVCLVTVFSIVFMEHFPENS